MKRLKLFLVIIIFNYLISDEKTFGKKLPDYVKICKRYDPELSKCWSEAVEKLKPYLIKGIPEFKIPPIEPFYIESLQLNQESSNSIRFKADLVNLTFSGGKDFHLISVDPDYKRKIAQIKINFPHLIMKGRYKALGRVLLFQFDSEGDFEGDFKNVTVNGTYKLDSYLKNNESYVKIVESKHDVQIDNMYIYLHDLFKNNPEITENVNKAINENIDILYNDFKPLLTKTMGTILTEYTNRAYGEYPYDVLLPIN